MLLADLTLRPELVVAWVIAGILAGWLAGKVLQEASYGLGDLMLGIIGALVCGASFGFFVTGDPSFWGGLLASLIGAWIVIAVGRFIGVHGET